MIGGHWGSVERLKVLIKDMLSGRFNVLDSRVSRVVGGWAKMAKKCLTPSKIQNSKKWSKVCSRVLWNRVTMAGS